MLWELCVCQNFLLFNLVSGQQIQPPPPPPPPYIPDGPYGVSTGTHPANGKGSHPPLCGPDTEQLNRNSPGAPLAQPPKGKEG